VTTAATKPLPGEKFIQAEQSVPIALKGNASGKQFFCVPARRIAQQEIFYPMVESYSHLFGPSRFRFLILMGVSSHEMMAYITASRRREV
jgi:hypothetical protein